MTKFSPDLKEKLNKLLNSICDKIYDLITLFPKNEKTYKYCLFQLEETRINFENNRHIEINSITNHLLLTNENNNHAELLRILDEIEDTAMRQYLRIVEDYFDENFIKTKYSDKNDIIKGILYYPIIRKEFINYVMNDENWEEEPINIEGYDAKTLSSMFSIINSYGFLVALKKYPEATKNELKKILS